MKPVHALIVTLCLAGFAPGAAVATDAPPRPAPAPAVDRVVARSSFVVRASRFGLGKSYRVDVAAALSGLDGVLFVELDSPLRAALGVEALDVSVRLLDADDSEIEMLQARVQDGMRAFAISFRLPSSGAYRFQLQDDGLDAGPARVRIEPGGCVEMAIDAFIDTAVVTKQASVS